MICCQLHGGAQWGTLLESGADWASRAPGDRAKSSGFKLSCSLVQRRVPALLPASPLLPGLRHPGPQVTADASHSPSPAWGRAVWSPAFPGRWGDRVVESQRQGRMKRRRTQRARSCCSCCCYCSSRQPRWGPQPLLGARAPPRAASALGSRALCAPASAQCLWGLAAGRLPWLFKRGDTDSKGRGRKEAAAWRTPKLSSRFSGPGLGPRGRPRAPCRGRSRQISTRPQFQALPFRSSQD